MPGPGSPAYVALARLNGSLESQVMTSAKRFETLNIDTGGKSIDPLPVVEQSPRPLTKLAVAIAAAEEAVEDRSEAEEKRADAEETAAE